MLRLIGSGSDSLTGQVSRQDLVTGRNGYRAPFSRSHPAVNLAGRYTMLISGATNADSSTIGQGAATLVVNSAGVIVLTGTLAEGTPITQRTSVAEHGAWPFYVLLYGGKGSFFGWMNLHETVTNEVHWTKKSGMGGALYTQGFTNELTALGSRYSVPGTGTNVLNLTTAEVLLDGGNLTQPLTNVVTLSAANKITLTPRATNQLALAVTGGHGLVYRQFHPS